MQRAGSANPIALLRLVYHLKFVNYLTYVHPIGDAASRDLRPGIGVQ